MKLVSIFILLCFFSCKDSSNQIVVDSQNTQKQLVTKLDVENIKYIEFLPDSKVNKEISNWEKYHELERIVDDVKSANFSFFKENSEIVSTLMEELKSTIPETINSPQVFSRMIALETKVFKLESVVNLSKTQKETTIEIVKEFFIAFSNLNLQMNKKVEKESQNIRRPN